MTHLVGPSKVTTPCVGRRVYSLTNAGSLSRTQSCVLLLLPYKPTSTKASSKLLSTLTYIECNSRVYSSSNNAATKKKMRSKVELNSPYNASYSPLLFARQPKVYIQALSSLHRPEYFFLSRVPSYQYLLHLLQSQTLLDMRVLKLKALINKAEEYLHLVLINTKKNWPGGGGRGDGAQCCTT